MMRNTMTAMMMATVLQLPMASWAAEDGPSAAAPEVSATVELKEVPTPVMEEAKRAAPGAYFQQARWVLRNDQREYRISGSLFRQEVDVYVRENGELLRVDTNNRDD